MNAIILNRDELRETLTEISIQVTQSVLEQIRAEKPVARQVMTMAQLAEYLQVTNQSIRNWIRRDENDNPLPLHGVGADPRFHLSEIDEWTRREAARQTEKRKKNRECLPPISTNAG